MAAASFHFRRFALNFLAVRVDMLRDKGGLHGIFQAV